jgi:hypothetical protein
MSSFGTFTLTDKGEPIFIMSSDLGSQFKIKQRSQIGSGNISTSNLNFTQVREGTSLTRETVEKIYSKFLTCMGRAIFENRNIVITIHRVAEVSISNGELVCNFLPQFLSLFRGGGDMKTAKQWETIRAAAKQDRLRATQYEVQAPARMDRFGAEEEPARRSKGATTRPSSAGRGGYNPITGASGGPTAGSVRPRASSAVAGRRPSSAGSYASRPSISTTDLLDSPGAGRYGGGGAGGRHGATTGNVVRPGLRKEQLDRFNKTQNDAGRPRSASAAARPGAAAVDARQIAAKALNTGDIVDKVRRKIVERGGSNGIRSITRLLSIMDDNGDKRLNKDELLYGLRDYGINLTPTELEQVFMYFDRDGNGFIDCTEFLVGLRGDLPPQRKKFIRMAFDILDVDKSGKHSCWVDVGSALLLCLVFFLCYNLHYIFVVYFRNCNS